MEQNNVNTVEETVVEEKAPYLHRLLVFRLLYGVLKIN